MREKFSSYRFPRRDRGHSCPALRLLGRYRVYLICGLRALRHPTGTNAANVLISGYFDKGQENEVPQLAVAMFAMHSAAVMFGCWAFVDRKISEA